MPSQLRLRVCLLDISRSVKLRIHINHYGNVGKLYFFFLRVYTKTVKLYSGPQINIWRLFCGIELKERMLDLLRGSPLSSVLLAGLYLCARGVYASFEVTGNGQKDQSSLVLGQRPAETFVGCYTDSSCYFQQNTTVLKFLLTRWWNVSANPYDSHREPIRLFLLICYCKLQMTSKRPDAIKRHGWEKSSVRTEWNVSWLWARMTCEAQKVVNLN